MSEEAKLEFRIQLTKADLEKLANKKVVEIDGPILAGMLPTKFVLIMRPVHHF